MRSLIPWRTSGLPSFEGFRNEMQDLMQRFFGESSESNGPTALMKWTPRVDVEETDKEIVVKADLPGVDPKNIDVSVTDSTLVLRGEKKEEREEKKKNYHRIERSQGEFYREILLPTEAETDKVAATSVKGVVTITIPKKAGAQPKRISVKAQD